MRLEIARKADMRHDDGNGRDEHKGQGPHKRRRAAEKRGAGALYRNRYAEPERKEPPLDAALSGHASLSGGFSFSAGASNSASSTPL